MLYHITCSHLSKNILNFYVKVYNNYINNIHNLFTYKTTALLYYICFQSLALLSWAALLGLYQFSLSYLYTCIKDGKTPVPPQEVSIFF